MKILQYGNQSLGWLAMACFTITLNLIGPGWLMAAGRPVRLVIEDNAGLFSEGAKESARQRLSQVNAQVDREVHFKTYPGLPENLVAKMKAAGDDRNKKSEVWREFTSSHLKGERGLVVLVCWKPGHVEVAADKALTAAGFDTAKTRSLREKLAKSLNDPAKAKDEATRKQELDQALGAFVNEVAVAMPIEKARSAAVQPVGGQQVAAQEGDQSNLLGWVCLGAVGLAVVWLIFGAMRGSSMGGGGYGGGGAPGYGGGGGGGFFSNMLGGMFGAAAGMWMYSHFFGGGTPGASAGGLFGGGDTSADEAGTGDFSNGNDSGGDFGDSGDSGGGGDWGGGGGSGDFGGGDFGGD